MKPVGLRRDYRATVNGVKILNQSKAEIQRVIRNKLRRVGSCSKVTFTFIEELTA